MSKALIRVTTKYRPQSGEFQGMRIQACIPNLAARKMVKTSGGFRATDEQVPAFRKPYLILESSDYVSVHPSDMERFQKLLTWEGFREFEMLTDLNGEKPGSAKLPEQVQAELDVILDKLRAQHGNKTADEALF